MTIAAEEHGLTFYADGELLGACVVDGPVRAVMFKDRSVAWFDHEVNVAVPVKPERINAFFVTHEKKLQEFLALIRDRPDNTPTEGTT